MEIKIAVGGCRDYNDRKYIFPCLDNSISKLDKDAKIVILSGHCSGVDTVAEEYASLRGYGTMIFPADWKNTAEQQDLSETNKWWKKPILLLHFGTEDQKEPDRL